ncbi:hypothetical protein CDD82_5793 [Ophiocordyceps australis]|uniref:RRM domain-containing protein n=1 Tax=Ophiocordyceps australis TaxID=1399860 RepID=A0A2C5YYH6_9HYPO|nr:hypothetical protein CDD82_5793 [Ophiocordyceps australis]
MEIDFPTKLDDFDADERISYSKLDDKYIGVRDDGVEFEFDLELKRWLPITTDDAEDTGDALDVGGCSLDGLGDGAQRKRKQGADKGSENADSSQAARPSKKTKAPPKPKQNTAVYVTGLPPDASVPEIHDVFSRKGGLIAEEIDSGAPRIKLYRDDAGHFKGDALIVFFKPDSVRMAIMLLDDSYFRYTPSGQGQGKIHVQEADSSYKKIQQHQQDANAAIPPSDAARNTPDVRRPKRDKDRQKIIRKTQKLDAKLADWSDDEDDRFPAVNDAKSSRTVVLRQMFRIFELEEDPAAILDIKQDIREECSKLGTVTNVVLYDQEPEGIVTVRFHEADAATACIKAMNGRPFDGRVVEASLGTGKERFRRSDNKEHD